MDRGLSLIKSNNKSMLLRSQIEDFYPTQQLFESKGEPNAATNESLEDRRVGLIDIHLINAS